MKEPVFLEVFIRNQQVGLARPQAYPQAAGRADFKAHLAALEEKLKEDPLKEDPGEHVEKKAI